MVATAKIQDILNKPADILHLPNSPPPALARKHQCAASQGGCRDIHLADVAGEGVSSTGPFDMDRGNCFGIDMGTDENNMGDEFID